MKTLKTLWLSCASIALCTSNAQAVPIEAVSFLTMTHGFTVSGGGVPPGVASSVSGPAFDAFSVSTAIDDPAAILAVDDTDVVPGCIGCSPSLPFTSVRTQRTNRPDPTEFSLASYDIESFLEQDTGVDTVSLAVGEREVSRSGLAQTRITSTAVDAGASSEFGLTRTQFFENVGNTTVSFNITGFFDAFLLSRYSGSDGFASASTSVNWLFSGIEDGDLLYLPLDTYFLDADEIGLGVDFTENLTSLPPAGFQGLNFSAGVNATGSGAFSEVSLNAFHAFLFNLTLDPGQTAAMQFRFEQFNTVGYAPESGTGTVPVPSGLVLLSSGLGLVAGLGGRRREPLHPADSRV